MSQNIDQKEWLIQERAMDKPVLDNSAETRDELEGYRKVYQLLDDAPMSQPPSLLAEGIVKTVTKRKRKQRVIRIIMSALLFAMAIAGVFGLTVLLPQSALLTEVSQAAPWGLIICALIVTGLVGLSIRKLAQKI